MSSKIPTRRDRLWRLKTRLGWRPPRFTLRIKPGGHLHLPPALTRLVGLHAGDQVDVAVEDGRLVITWPA